MTHQNYGYPCISDALIAEQNCQTDAAAAGIRRRSAPLSVYIEGVGYPPTPDFLTLYAFNESEACRKALIVAPVGGNSDRHQDALPKDNNTESNRIITGGPCVILLSSDLMSSFEAWLRRWVEYVSPLYSTMPSLLFTWNNFLSVQ